MCGGTEGVQSWKSPSHTFYYFTKMSVWPELEAQREASFWISCFSYESEAHIWDVRGIIHKDVDSTWAVCVHDENFRKLYCASSGTAMESGSSLMSSFAISLCRQLLVQLGHRGSKAAHYRCVVSDSFAGYQLGWREEEWQFTVSYYSLCPWDFRFCKGFFFLIIGSS